MSFKSKMQWIGHEINVGFDFIIHYAETTGEVAISLFAPSLGPLFNQTVAAVATAEQAALAVQGSKVSGQQKLANVVALMGPLIAQGLKDAGKDSSDAAIQAYINAIVTILNTAPAPTAPTTTLASGGVS